MENDMKKLKLVIGVCLLSISSIASSAVYKWIDNGVVEYGSYPPARTPSSKVSLQGMSVSTQVSQPIVHAKPIGNSSATRKKERQIAIAQARLNYLAALSNYSRARRVRTGNEHNYATYQRRKNALKATMNATRDRMLLTENAAK